MAPNANVSGVDAVPFETFETFVTSETCPFPLRSSDVSVVSAATVPISA